MAGPETVSTATPTPTPTKPTTTTPTRSPNGPTGNGLTIPLKRSERALFTGRTGSGKSTLADKLIRTLRYRTVVLDPKGLWDFPGYLPVVEYDPRPETRYQVFRPLEGARPTRDRLYTDWELFLQQVWRDPQPTLVYVDELTMVTTPQYASPILFKFARQGRAFGKGLWTGTQRPSGIPGSFLTEAEHWFVFDLRHGDDRKKVAGFLGDAAEERPKGRYSFWYANPELPNAVLFRQPS